MKCDRTALVAAVWSVLLWGCTKIPEGAKAVEPFDQARYLGKWYEVMRSDNRFERDLDNVTANYVLRDDGAIRVENGGYNTAKGKWEDITGKALPVDGPDVGRLKVSFFGPFYSGYNVIALDSDYTHALVVGNDIGYVWLLSRTPNMPQAVQQRYLEQLVALGCDTSALIRVKHDRVK